MIAAPPVDVAVIGGGIVGCATAAYLAEAGRRVLLVEAREIAAAASGRNSGVVQHPFDPVLAELYLETVGLLRELEAAAPERFRLPAEPAGLLYIAATAEGAAAAETLATDLLLSHPGLAPSYLEGVALARLEPALAGDLAACRLSIGYPVAPAVATTAFAARARDLGVEIVVGEAASLRRVGDRVDGIVVGGRPRPAAAVVVAAGPWTPEIVDPRGRWRPIERLWGAVAEVALADPPRHVLQEVEIGAAIEPEGSGEPDVSFSLVTADERSVVGSTFTRDEPDDVAFTPALLERARRFVPAIHGAAVLGSRRCARPLSGDGRPLVGAVPGIEGLFVAAGHGPWGISTGAASARLIAELVLGSLPGPPAALDPGRLGPVGDQRQPSPSNR